MAGVLLVLERMCTGLILRQRVHAQLIEHARALFRLFGAGGEAAREDRRHVGGHPQHVDETIWLVTVRGRADEQELAARRPRP